MRLPPNLFDRHSPPPITAAARNEEPAMTSSDRYDLPADEVCERIRRDGRSVFPVRANTGGPVGPVEAWTLMRSHAR